MYYLDVTRFMFSIVSPPTVEDSVVLESNCYHLYATGYPCSIHSDRTVEQPNWDSIAHVTVRLDQWCLCIDQLWRDLACILNNPHPTWLTLINLSSMNVYAHVFERIGSFASPVYLQIFDNQVPGFDKSYTADSIVVPTGFELVDLHFQTVDNTTLFVPVHPAGSTVNYSSVLPEMSVEG